MSENEFWAFVWKLCGVVVCVLIVTIGAASSYTNKKVVDAIEAGADPVAASCALVGKVESQILCYHALNGGKGE